jgi:phosphoribosyl-dephospho-CoA transferase
LQRNTLVWLTPQAWRVVHGQAWDALAQDLLRYWQTCHFPWVVARQRPGVAADAVCLGLPAPQHWGRRRLGTEVALDGIARQGQFPLLHEVAQSSLWGITAAPWLAQGAGLAAQVRVFGSYGWQFMTGMPYVRPGSDLDLSVHVPDLPAAVSALEWLAQTGDTGDRGNGSGTERDAPLLPLRVDGEIVFAQGQALAWREMLQLRQGLARQALVKDRLDLRLLDWPGIVALAKAAAAPSLLPASLAAPVQRPAAWAWARKPCPSHI